MNMDCGITYASELWKYVIHYAYLTAELAKDDVRLVLEGDDHFHMDYDKRKDMEHELYVTKAIMMDVFEHITGYKPVRIKDKRHIDDADYTAWSIVKTYGKEDKETKEDNKS